MKTEALSIIIHAPKHAVVNYLADIDNYPEWATEFCQELKKAENHYKVKSPMGELFFRIQADINSGEIKYFATTEPGGTNHLPSHVRPINETSCEYVINFTQPKGLPDDAYRQQCRSIKTELQNIQSNFST